MGCGVGNVLVSKVDHNACQIYNLCLHVCVYHVDHDVCVLSQCNCAVIPLIGDEPLSLVDGFRRLWELLSAGLLLPGSIGIPDPCEVCEGGRGEGVRGDGGRV